MLLIGGLEETYERSKIGGVLILSTALVGVYISFLNMVIVATY